MIFISSRGSKNNFSLQMFRLSGSAIEAGGLGGHEFNHNFLQKA
jgi:hypothetical protein